MTGREDIGKKILVVSDTHGKTSDLISLLKKAGTPDILIHLGDIGFSEEELYRIAGCPVEAVAGNNDFFLNLPSEKIIEVGKYKLLLMHGHGMLLYQGADAMKQHAVYNGADMLLFGHTHEPLIDMRDDIWLLNPGSISRPRQYGREKTYILMELDCRGEMHVTLNKFG